VKDVDDMYRRLTVMSVQLEEIGLLHERNYGVMLRRLAGNIWFFGKTWSDKAPYVSCVKTIVDVLEPVKGYKREAMQNATQFTPLTRLVDTARPDSAVARDFAESVDFSLYKEQNWFNRGPAGAATDVISEFLRELSNASAVLDGVNFFDSPLLLEVKPLAKDIIVISGIGDEAIKQLMSGNVPSDQWRDEKLARLELAAQPKAAVELVVIQPIKELVIAAAEQEKRKTMSTEEWKKRIKELAAPKKPSK